MDHLDLRRPTNGQAVGAGAPPTNGVTGTHTHRRGASTGLVHPAPGSLSPRILVCDKDAHLLNPATKGGKSVGSPLTSRAGSHVGNPMTSSNGSNHSGGPVTSKGGNHVGSPRTVNGGGGVGSANTRCVGDRVGSPSMTRSKDHVGCARVISGRDVSGPRVRDMELNSARVNRDMELNSPRVNRDRDPSGSRVSKDRDLGPRVKDMDASSPRVSRERDVSRSSVSRERDSSKSRASTDREPSPHIRDADLSPRLSKDRGRLGSPNISGGGVISSSSHLRTSYVGSPSVRRGNSLTGSPLNIVSKDSNHICSPLAFIFPNGSPLLSRVSPPGHGYSAGAYTSRDLEKEYLASEFTNLQLLSGLAKELSSISKGSSSESPLELLGSSARMSVSGSESPSYLRSARNRISLNSVGSCGPSSPEDIASSSSQSSVSSLSQHNADGGSSSSTTKSSRGSSHRVTFDMDTLARDSPDHLSHSASHSSGYSSKTDSHASSHSGSSMSRSSSSSLSPRGNNPAHSPSDSLSPREDPSAHRETGAPSACVSSSSSGACSSHGEQSSYGATLKCSLGGGGLPSPRTAHTITTPSLEAGPTPSPAPSPGIYRRKNGFSRSFGEISAYLAKKSIADSYDLETCWFCGRPMPGFGGVGSGGVGVTCGGVAGGVSQGNQRFSAEYVPGCR